jgi:hypothetical protein
MGLAARKERLIADVVRPDQMTSSSEIALRKLLGKRAEELGQHEREQLVEDIVDSLDDVRRSALAVWCMKGLKWR